jgi:hypothetical protein
MTHSIRYLSLAKHLRPLLKSKILFILFIYFSLLKFPIYSNIFFSSKIFFDLVLHLFDLNKDQDVCIQNR